MSRRTDQMASVLHRAVQSVLNEGLADPRLDGTMVTVTKVKVSDDTRTAVVNVSVLPEKKQKLAWHALRDASRHIRRQAGELVSIYKLPDLIIKLDTSLKKQAAVYEAIARAKDELADPETDTTPPTTDTPGDDHT